MALTQQRLLELFTYDPCDGLFVRRVTTSHNARAGQIAGCKSHRYLAIHIDGKIYLAHRLAWLYMHGEWPKHDIDHLNGDGRDNRIANLRDVPRKVNLWNLVRTKPRSLPQGVKLDPRSGTYSARAANGGDVVHLGTYSTPEEAELAYKLFRRRQDPLSRVCAGIESTESPPVPRGMRKSIHGLPRGVRKSGNRFEGRFTFNGKTKYIGTFDTVEAAALAVERARIENGKRC